MNTHNIKQFREKIKNNFAFGIFMKTIDPAFVEIAGHSGMDFIILDMEHGSASIETMQNHVRAAQLSNMLPIIRVAHLDELAILQALDIGAAGVQIPKISTVEDARLAVEYSKYHPLGKRGVCRFVRAAAYSSNPREAYFSTANENTLVIIQLEGNNSFNELDAILSVKGIDIIFIGPYDLSQSLGLTGQTSHPFVVDVMQDIVKKAQAVGCTLGTFTDSQETYNLWKNAGVRYLSYSVDVGIFYEACVSLVNQSNQ